MEPLYLNMRKRKSIQRERIKIMLERAFEDYSGRREGACERERPREYERDGAVKESHRQLMTAQGSSISKHLIQRACDEK